MNIIVRITTGVLQDASPASDPYKKVTPVYVALSIASLAVSLLLICLYCLSLVGGGKFESMYVDIGRLQWTRKQRLQKGELIMERKEMVGGGEEVDLGGNEGGMGKEGKKMRKISMGCFIGLGFLVAGSWCAYFWGVATGNND